MNKSERIKSLLERYFDGNLGREEQEQLYFLLNQKDLEEAAFGAAYKLWEESEKHQKAEISGEVFKRIKEQAKINNKDVLAGNLILKGMKYEQSHSRRAIIRTCLKYAAIVVFAFMVSGITYLTLSKTPAEETVMNEITVPYGSRISLMLQDSSEVWVNSGSTLKYPSRFGEGKREVYLEGEAFFDIQHRPDKPFFVKTSDIDIRVLGTRFNVKSYPEENIIETTLVSGQIILLPNQPEVRNGKQTMMQPNQKAVYFKEIGKLELNEQESIKNIKTESKKTIRLLETRSVEQIGKIMVDTAWKDELLVFHDEPFRTLAKKLERWYGVNITLEDDEVADFEYTGTIRNETVEQALKAFSVASAIDYTVEQNSISITKKRNSE